MLNAYQIYWYFIIYAFLGWVVEVAYHAVKNHNIVNRGFLCGPFCPVYGFGMLGVLEVTTRLAHLEGESEPYQVNLFVLLIAGMIITTSIELVAGWILYVLFHARWWDYSGERFNFHGFICLKFSIFWAVGVVVVVTLIHPFVEASSVNLVPEDIGVMILGGIYLVVFVDFAITLSMIAGMNKYFTELDTLQAKMKLPADKMTNVIATNAMQASEKFEEGQVQTALAKAELRDATEQHRRKLGSYMHSIEKQEDAIAARIEEISSHFRNHNLFDTGRLLRAFPSMKMPDHEESLRRVRQMLTPGYKASAKEDMKPAEENEQGEE